MSPSYLDQELLGVLEQAFLHHAGADAKIDLAELQKALGLKSRYLAERMFALFDTNGDGVITKNEFLSGVRRLIFGTDREKLEFAFRLHDDDGDGTLDRAELVRMISLSLAESEIADTHVRPPEDLADALLSAADENHDGRLSFDELEKAVAKRPELLRQLTRSEAIWIAPNEELLVLVDERAAGKRLDSGSERELAPRLVLGVFALANLGIFSFFMISDGAFVSSNPLMSAGRASARCLDFSGALLLVPVMRRLATWVRSTWLGQAIPVDQAIDFHRLVGHALFFTSLFHAAAVIAAFAVGHSSLEAFGLSGRMLTGFALFAVFLVLWFFSLAYVRRDSRFELFAGTHLLWIAWFALAIAHGPAFGLWVGVPLLGFLVEQAFRWARRAPESAILRSRPLRSGVTRLEIARPPGFSFAPGDYVFLRVPAIAKREWHPFTISSAPERDNLTFHVRSLGDWTAALRRHVEKTPDAPELSACLDGPYGSPSGRIFESKNAILIASGIGVTPFASVLESIVLRAYGTGERPSKLEKVHFFWLNRDQYSFEWFRALLDELDQIDLRGMLEVHLCMTGARSGATAMGLEIAREIMHASGHRDIVTGLRTETHVGPPDWEAMLGEIRRRHEGERVDAFYCGPPVLAKKLRPLCERLGISFREERF